FYLQIDSATNATPNDSFEPGLILDDDAGPRLFVSDAAALEGNTGASAGTDTFTVTLQPASPTPVTVQYKTAAGTAVAGSDYTSEAGTLTFNQGVTTQKVNVPLVADTTKEPDEYFTLLLKSATQADVSHGDGG